MKGLKHKFRIPDFVLQGNLMCGFVGEQIGTVFTVMAVGAGYYMGWKSAVGFYRISEQHREATWSQVGDNHEL
jgi:hypothetical protein